MIALSCQCHIEENRKPTWQHGLQSFSGGDIIEKAVRIAGSDARGKPPVHDTGGPLFL